MVLAKTPLTSVVDENKFISLAKLLLEKGANPSEVDDMGISLLSHAVQNGHFELAVLLCNSWGYF